MDHELSAIRQEIEDWKEKNREFLPVNIDYWDLCVSRADLKAKNETMLGFGKYNSQKLTTESFYKPLSRILKLED